jgi:hypothetical protein
MANISAANLAELQSIHDAMFKESAVELPIDATIVERLARVSAAVGFLNAGIFKERVQQRPISILVDFLKFLGT